jgi:hypothetical protein
VVVLTPNAAATLVAFLAASSATRFEIPSGGWGARCGGSRSARMEIAVRSGSVQCARPDRSGGAGHDVVFDLLHWGDRSLIRFP